MQKFRDPELAHGVSGPVEYLTGVTKILGASKPLSDPTKIFVLGVWWREYEFRYSLRSWAWQMQVFLLSA